MAMSKKCNDQLTRDKLTITNSRCYKKSISHSPNYYYFYNTQQMHVANDSTQKY